MKLRASSGVLLLAAFGCGGTPATTPDAGDGSGTGVDSGSGTADAGRHQDAGSPDAATPDASTPDSGHVGHVDAGAADAGPALSGILVGGTGAYPGPIEGVHFRTPTQSGFTSDAGTFQYAANEPVTFSVADVDFRPTPGAPMVSPWQLAAQGQCHPNAELQRLLVLLYSLDVDGNAGDGTQVVAAPFPATHRALSSLTDADVAALIGQLIPGRGPVDGGLAVDEFITQMDAELWQQIGLNNFPLAWTRSQGAATDGLDFYFSYQYGFEETDFNYSSIKTAGGPLSPPWPAALTLLGSNHIGDVDYFDGGIYAGVEDHPNYTHPYIVHFDLGFNALESFALPPTLLTDGVPWVAVDGANRHLLTSRYNPAPAIYVFDVATANQVGQVKLSQTLSAVQGAKMFEGSLYASTNDANKDIYKINIETGTVIPLWAFGFTMEEEGCVFHPMADGSLLHTLNVDSNSLGMDFRHHQRTREPLRKSVCQ
jgi:uncharacterized protein DUF6923